MGSITSSQINPDNITPNEATNATCPSAQGSETNPISDIISKVDGRDFEQNPLRMDANHSANLALKHGDTSTSDVRRSHLGITTLYLSEENLRLLLANKELEKTIKRLTETQSRDCAQMLDDPDEIYGESAEQKLRRLQQHLASERQEKWLAIENCEKSRVDLINCESELRKSNQKLETLAKELEASKVHIEDLKKCKMSERLHDGENGVDSASLPSSSSSLLSSGSTAPETESRSSLKEFRAELKAKREARQRALFAVSVEMNSLREQLRNQKMLTRKLERELESKSESMQDKSLESVISDNNSLRNEIDILTENVERLENVSSENIKLKFEVKRLNAEMDSLNLNVGELKFEYYEEKRKHERTLRKLTDLEKSLEGQASTMDVWKEEREKFYEKYDQEKEEVVKRTNALREVLSITRQMLAIRECQVQELKGQLKDIEDSVKRTKIMEENGLKAEYEKQLENIRKLKELYEERVRLMEVEKQKVDEKLNERTKQAEDQEKEIEDLKREVESSKQSIKFERQENESMDREMRLTVAKCKDLENEISLINNMFTQMLLGPYNSGNETDLDKLTELLQENHELITEMTCKEDGNEIASVLPKLLLDLINQVDGSNERKEYDMTESSDTISEQSESLLAENQGAVLPIVSYKDAKLFKPPPEEAVTTESKPRDECKTLENVSPAVQEIASNLPKVWRVLMELLSHHSVPEEPTRGDEKQCYKRVDTPNGPRTVISVSRTFIRLKDLILEKKSLQKELTRLKQLNSHLETRLDDQEKRLSHVQCELHKTWGIVGRMRAQHQQLHNHEKILRYELQEKRVMLSELKHELEYCKEKWERARQKNNESETEWKKLRREFAARKTKGYPSSSLNDSGESGFSDEQNESGEDFDADRSNTQSPVDQKMLEDGSEDATEKRSEFVVHLIKQSEENLQQTTENIEETNFEECQEINRVLRTISRARESTQADDMETIRETRDQRLRRLEEQCKLLVRQVDITSHKSKYLNNRLEELHEQYGSQESTSNQLRDKLTSLGLNPEANTSNVSEESDDDETAQDESNVQNDENNTPDAEEQS